VADVQSAINPRVRVVEKPLAELKPADYNPRTISAEALRGLTASIKRFGNVQPIVWNKRTGNVVSGHQRLRVLAAAGATVTDVVVVDLDETEERALNVTQNNPHISGEFTADLQPLLDTLEPMGAEVLAELRLDGLREIPAFDPTSGDDQPSLDEKKHVTCPECGHDFTP
jgi:hypothetical protein